MKKSEILTRDGGYLNIFQGGVKIDKNLLKWQEQAKLAPKENNIEQVKYWKDEISNANYANYTTPEKFLDLDKTQFNIYIGKNIIQRWREKKAGEYNELAFLTQDEIVFHQSNEKKSFGKTVIETVKKFFRVNKGKKEEVYELNIFDFFAGIKSTCKGSAQKYIMRIKPYMIALKQAQEMGQIALADQLAAEIFNNKYESILYSEGFYTKISEAQIVDFVKKTEKGVRLDYISNFARFVPENVIEIKKKADSLLVFDNYCVLYYDPDYKSYKMTKEEEEAERRKKTDPILFGMISGSNNLYYVADWIDEYCDLTLDEFIKVSGIEKKDIQMDENIRL